jgi:ribosomal protein S18 acetylase RimI-like enzyme
MIARLDLAAVADLKEALPRFAHRPVAHLSHLRPEQVVAYWLDEITEDLTDESSVAFVSRGRELIEGLVLYADSPWDTKVVGRRIGFLKHLAAKADDARSPDMLDALLDEAIRHATSRGTECLTCKIQPLQFAAVHALERHGFLLMDTILDFVLDFSRTPLEGMSVPKRANGLTTRLATPEDLPEVLAVSEKAFANHYGRYNSDTKMPQGTATKVYREWVRSSFRGWADWILVAEIEGRIAGFGVWKKASPLEVRHALKLGHYNLAGVHPDFSGQGIYTALAADGMRMTQSFARYLDGPVHVSNYPVHRALQKLGWKIAGARHSFHKWLPGVSA